MSIPSGDSGKRAGGLEVALRPALERNGGVWFGWSGKAVPRADVEMHTVCHKNVTYVVTDLSEEDYQEYYNGFANRVLWPILHFRLDLAEFARRDLTGYMRVNEHFATELERIIEPDDLIWVHDYHLIPIADALRRRGHANRIGFFLHVPMPPPEVYDILAKPRAAHPAAVAIRRGRLPDRGRFRQFRPLPHRRKSRLRVTRDAGVRIVGSPVRVHLNGRQTRVGSFPVGIEPWSFQTLARRNVRSPLVKELVTSLGGRTLIIGVDRLDYSKGLVQRLEAFEIFLARNPDWHGKVTYLQITPKNRSEIPEYAELAQAVGSIAGRINGRYGEVSWTPIRYVNRVYTRSAAGRALSHGAGRTGDAAAGRNESRRQGVRRRAGSERSRRAHSLPLRRRRCRWQTCAARQSL